MPNASTGDARNVPLQHSEGTEALVEGWSRRHDRCPRIAEQIEQHCDNGDHQLLFRGAKNIRYYKDLFTLGYKSRPLYLANGVTEPLSRHAWKIVQDREEFRRLASDFVNSPMISWADNSKSCTVPELLKCYDTSPGRKGCRLAQLLLYGLQYQCSREEVKDWRDYLFVMSATSDESVALNKYALSHKRDQCPPQCALVVEYAPPDGSHLYEKMSDVIGEFASLQLGQFYPDHDSEYMIPFGMLPHYLLGCAKLIKIEGEELRYKVRYWPNPAIQQEGYSLDRPKELSEEQAAVAKGLNGEVAFAYHQWTGEEGDWCFLVGPHDPPEDISGTAPIG